jgi:molybdenum cofactor guanylyltransferase
MTAAGAVLAGGRGARLGGDKAVAVLGGRPLVLRPLAALEDAGLVPFVVAKPSTRLPALTAAVVLEPEEPTHPLLGVIAALRHSGEPLVILGADFPFVPPELPRLLAAAPEPLVVAAPGGEIQPLVARWAPALLPDLELALRREEPLRRTVADLGARLLGDRELAAFGDPERAFFNVNRPADLARAAAMLGR